MAPVPIQPNLPNLDQLSFMGLAMGSINSRHGNGDEPSNTAAGPTAVEQTTQALL